MRYSLLLILLSSCNLVKPIATNPEPNMKTVHMVSHHFGYDKDEYSRHPDKSCSQVDPDLRIYVTNFNNYFGVNVDTIVEFGEFSGDAVAVSVRGKNHIIVNKDKFYSQYSEYFRYYVIYHELGHAYFNLRHSKHGLMRPNAGLNPNTTFGENYLDLFINGRSQLKNQLNK